MQMILESPENNRVLEVLANPFPDILLSPDLLVELRKEESQTVIEAVAVWIDLMDLSHHLLTLEEQDLVVDPSSFVSNGVGDQ